MCTMKPIILISPEDVSDAFGVVFIMNKEYGNCIREAGGIPLGAGDFRAAETYAAYADGLVIPGGPDIHVARYGQIFTDFAEIASFSNTRDDFDFALCEAFLRQGKPILGIGRGAQVLNAALGGTLCRRLPSRLTADCRVTGSPSSGYAVVEGTPGAFNHQYGVHAVRIAEGSRLSRILGQEARVNSFHHQAVDRLGEGLKAAARSEDGVVEAFEHESLPVMGVQWHPEHPCEGYAQDLSVFRWLISMAEEGK